MTEARKSLMYRFAFITVLILAVYGNTLNHGFVWDDQVIIVENPLLKNLAGLSRVFLSEDRFSEAATGYYRPVTYLSFALDRLAWNGNAVGFNVTNLVLHILTVLLFFSVIRAMFKRENLAFYAALIFALHPVAGETVNFHAGGRNTLLSACFALLSLLCYLNKQQMAAIASFTLAIFSKEFALLLPLIFILYDRYLSCERKRWVSYLSYAVPVVCYLTLRSYAVEHGNLLKTMRLDNLLLIPRIIVRYLVNMIFPFNLKVMYDLEVDIGWLWIGIYALAVLAGLGAVLALRRRKEIVFSASWFALFLLPVTNIFPLGTAMMADRYAYFSLMGFSLLTAYCIGKTDKRIAYAVVTLLCVCYAAVDIQRNSFWKDDLTLFTRMTKDAPEMLIGFQNLGIHYYNAGDLPNAEKNLATAFEKKDLSDKTIHTLAALYWETDRVGLAVPLMLRMIEATPRNPQPHIMLSRLYEKQGNTVQAKAYHEKAVALFPSIEQVMSQRATALCREGEALQGEHKLVLAERKFQEALMMKLDFVPALIDMGSIAAEKGNLPKALDHFNRAAALSPINPMVHYNLSLTYELMGRQADAQEETRKFKELDRRLRQQPN